MGPSHACGAMEMPEASAIDATFHSAVMPLQPGDLISPESGVDYCTPPDLGDDLGKEGPATHGHTH